MYALRMGELMGSVFSRISTIFMVGFCGLIWWRYARALRAG
jgi:hypothetical protein